MSVTGAVSTTPFFFLLSSDMRLPNPFARIGLGLAACILVVLLVQQGLGRLLSHTLDSEWKDLILASIACILIVVVYVYVYKACEQRPITEFSAKGLGRNLLGGILLGALLQSLTIFVIYLAKDYTVLSIKPHPLHPRCPRHCPPQAAIVEFRRPSAGSSCPYCRRTDGQLLGPWPLRLYFWRPALR